MNIPAWAQSSANPEEVSLTITSLGKMGAALIVFLGVIGVIDPLVATQAWGNFVAQLITAVPVVFGIWSAGQAVYGIVRKIAVRIVGLFSGTPTV